MELNGFILFVMYSYNLLTTFILVPTFIVEFPPLITSAAPSPVIEETLQRRPSDLGSSSDHSDAWRDLLEQACRETLPARRRAPAPLVQALLPRQHILGLLGRHHGVPEEAQALLLRRPLLEVELVGDGQRAPSPPAAACLCAWELLQCRART